MTRTTLAPRDEAAQAALSLSVITPIYNEEKNIPILMDQLLELLQTLQKSFEIIAINDGSRDGSLAELRKQATLHPPRLWIWPNGPTRTRYSITAAQNSTETMLKKTSSASLDRSAIFQPPK